MKEERQQDRDSRGVILSRAYQPILRGYFGVAAIYYACIAISNFVMLRGDELYQMSPATLAALIGCGIAWHALRNPLEVGKLEAITFGINILILINIFVAFLVDYREAKLVYFVMAVMVFALASVTMRQAVGAIALALAMLAFHLMRLEAQEWSVFGFIAFAAAISAISIAYFLRRTIEMAVRAQQSADFARGEAEVRLEKAEKLGESMRRQSLMDSLTSLPNRRAFFGRMKELRQHAAEGTDESDDPAAKQSWLILLDLDGFKAVNDNHGHLIGDELLKSVSRRLEQHCGEEAHVSRMGGDEFSIILKDVSSGEKAEDWCERLLVSLSRVYLIEDRLVLISGSVGCYAIDPEETDARLVQNADFALLYAKRNGKNRVVLFRDEHVQEAAARFRIEQALRVARFNEEIELVFQPQYDLDEDCFTRAEVLARWSSPSIGDVGPEKFIKIAEESGLIAGITIAVLKKAIAALKSWEQPFPVSINLSGSDMLNDVIIDEIITIVEESGIDPTLIEFEVTETAMMSDSHRAKENLVRLSKLGHAIALDDFGSGYSNFSYLRTLPIDKLKVDRAFLDDLSDPMTEKILRSLVGVARTLDVPCLLEGIEDELDLLTAKRVGAQSVQGFLFGQPVCAKEIQSMFLDVSGHGPASRALPGEAKVAG